MPERAELNDISATSDTALVIVARYPREGATKTRLARAIGDEETVALYRAFLADLALKFGGAHDHYDLHWCYTPGGEDFATLVATLVPTQSTTIRAFPQQGAGLGERLRRAFQTTHRLEYRKTVLIGSDSPHIHPDLIRRASDALDSADVVLGPAEDGGYYLIAMREPHDVFSGIPMSTGQVLRMTIELARRQGLSVATIDTLFDVDELADLLRLSQILREDSTLAPVTAAQLTTIKEYV
jgi:rSAM/selenodomain-associated transferase 1